MENAKFLVGIIGLGPLGMAFAKLLLGQGVPVLGYRRSGMDEVVAAGGMAAQSPADLVEKVEFVLDCLPHEEALLSLFEGELSIMDAVLPGQVILSLASHELINKQRLADLASARGGVVIDCEVSGTPAAIAGRAATIYLSGDAAAIASAAPVLALLSSQQVTLGSFGEATRMRISAEGSA
jgi:2-hydroxy-3-oxopropionate reductase